MAKRIRISSRSSQRIQLNAEGLTISQKQHDDLVKHINQLLILGKSVRDMQVNRYEYIDREVYGHLVLDKDDEKRQRDNELGHGVKPVDQKLPLTLIRLEEAITYILLVLAPDEGIYNAVASADKQKIAQAFTRLMNDHAQYFGHYRNLGIFFLNALKYNFGALLTEWQTIRGNLIGNDGTGGVNIQRDQIVQTGNQLTALDPYNTLYDPSVDPLNCHHEGEFVGYVEKRRGFWLRRAENRGELFNIRRVLETPGISDGQQTQYYRTRPVIDSNLYNDSSGASDWFSILSMGQYTGDAMGLGAEGSMHEVVPLWIQLYPNKWGLGPSKDLEIWRMTLVNGTTLVEGVPQTNAHGNLPILFAMPNADGFVWQTKSWAEYLIPFNRFASQQLNTHQRALRRKLYGLLFYNSNTIPDLKNNEHDLIAGKIEVKGAAQGEDIRRHIHLVTDGPETSETMQTIDQLDDIMEKVLPTQMAPQVADLERATQYQTAATVQSASRRNLKMAKIIDSQTMNACRRIQLYNILQYQPAVEVVTDQGDTLPADPKQFRDANLQFVISDGLRGLDKLTLILHYKDALNVIVQSAQAAQQIDLVKLIDHWTSLIGDNTDFSQFRLESQIDSLPLEQREQAFQLLQQALQAQGGQPGAGTPPAGPPPRP